MLQPVHIGKNIRVLAIADSDAETLPAMWELKRCGYHPTFERPANRAALDIALLQGRFDLAIAHYSAAELEPLEALALLQLRGHDIPFIIVGAHAGEHAAAEAIRSGAHGWVDPGNLSTLAPLIERELREAQRRREAQNETRAARAALERMRHLSAHIPAVVFRITRASASGIAFDYVGENCRRLLGIEAQALTGDIAAFLERVAPQDRADCERALARSAADLTELQWEGRLAGDEPPWIEMRASPRCTENGDIVWEGLMLNVTHSKLAQLESARAREQLAQFAAHIQQAKEEESGKVARDIRDDIGGNLTAIKLAARSIIERLPNHDKEMAEKTHALERLIDRSMEATSRLARDLRPGILDVGLVVAVEWQAEEFERRAGIPCSVACSEEEIALPPAVALAVFRIFQEALDNVTRHAGASRVEAELERNGHFVSLQVTDDGAGLSSEDMSKQGAFGIRGMVERARALGGHVDVLGLQGHGTRVLLRIPLDSEELPDSRRRNPS